MTSRQKCVAAFVATAVLGASGLMLSAQAPQAVGTWAPAGVLTESQSGGAVVLDDGRTLIVGGSGADGAPTDRVLIVNPWDNSLITAGRLLAARVGHTATLLADGRVLVTGGTVDGTLVADLELFNVETGASELVGALGQARTAHSAARLADGTVLIVGGVTPDGAVVAAAESFDPATNSTTPLASGLQSPRCVAILAGIAVDKGLLDLSQPVSAYIGAGWSKATPLQEAAITVRHLMEMNSGLKEDLGFDAAPDTKFFYNTPAYAVMKPVLEAAAKQPLAEITQAWLARPAAMHDTAWLDRPALMASAGNPTGLVTTPRDIARLGQLVLNGGVSDAGVRVISKAQLDALFVPTKTNPSYGRLWWLNGGAETVGVGSNPRRRPGPLIGAAPADMVAAMGVLDRKLYVVPSRKLVVVRTGQAAPDRGVDEQLWRLLVRAMPGG